MQKLINAKHLTVEKESGFKTQRTKRSAGLDSFSFLEKELTFNGSQIKPFGSNST
jgi:hypothetical protein